MDVIQHKKVLKIDSIILCSITILCFCIPFLAGTGFGLASLVFCDDPHYCTNLFSILFVIIRNFLLVSIVTFINLWPFTSYYLIWLILSNIVHFILYNIQSKKISFQRIKFMVLFASFAVISLLLIYTFQTFLINRINEFSGLKNTSKGYHQEILLRIWGFFQVIPAGFYISLVLKEVNYILHD